MTNIFLSIMLFIVSITLIIVSISFIKYQKRVSKLLDEWHTYLDDLWDKVVVSPKEINLRLITQMINKFERDYLKFKNRM